MKVHKCDENQSNSMKIHQSNVNSMIWWRCIYKMRVHDSDRKSNNIMEIQLCDKTYHFDKHLSLRWKFISPMKMYQSDEIYHIDDLKSPCWPIKIFYWVWLYLATKTLMVIICVMKIYLIDEIHYCNTIFTNNYVVNWCYNFSIIIISYLRR